MKYPGKILAIPGNQDGETFTVTDPKPLQAFLDNFCAPKAGVPKTASNVGIFREMVAQPGVYWLLKAPFLNLIGLYSNIVPETCAAPATITNRSKWLQATLTDLKKAKDAGDNRVLVITMHHPVFSEGGHSGSDFMLGQIDQVCTAAGIVPHALLAGHTHTYQRYTRTISRPMAAQMICIDAGCGGHAASSVKAASGQAVGDAVFVKSLRGYGYVIRQRARPSWAWRCSRPAAAARRRSTESRWISRAMRHLTHNLNATVAGHESTATAEPLLNLRRT